METRFNQESRSPDKFMVARQVQERSKARPGGQSMALSQISGTLGGAGLLQSWRLASYSLRQFGSFVYATEFNSRSITSDV